MRVIGKGNANILIDYGDPLWLYRCCVRFADSLKRNNDYSLQNFRYINESVEGILGNLLCTMKLEIVPLDTLRSLISRYITDMDDSKIVVFKMPNLKHEDLQKVIYADHFTKIYSSVDTERILLEFKPKWLHNDTKYCRNCTHSRMKQRNMTYCYTQLLENPLYIDNILGDAGSFPSKFREDLRLYFSCDENVLLVLKDAQKKLNSKALVDIKSVCDVTDELALAMSLRDVTCFIEWRSNTEELFVTVVDVDLKPKEKAGHWISTHQQLERYDNKCSH